MVQEEKLPSMFAGSAGVELKSEKRIEKKNIHGMYRGTDHSPTP